MQIWLKNLQQFPFPSSIVSLTVLWRPGLQIMEPFAFVTSLAAGQILAQQLHHGTGSGTTSMGPPKRPMMPATRPANESSKLPTCPMVYAIISDMSIFGNPNVPDSHYSAYPPQVPVNTPVLPALVPLGLLDVNLNVECHISTAFVTVEGTWDLNCVRSRATCDCLLALPMDHQVSPPLLWSVFWWECVS